MVGVKWLCRCDVFVSQVAGISVHVSEGKGGNSHACPKGCLKVQILKLHTVGPMCKGTPIMSPRGNITRVFFHFLAHCFGFATKFSLTTLLSTKPT